MKELLGLDALMDWPDFSKLMARLAIDLFFAAVVIRWVYFRLYRSRELVFTYYVFNAMTFCLCLLLRKVPAELGFALALFGVFGILKYRTEQIRIRDLTYLFIVIGIGILNGVANKTVSLAELLAVNGVIAVIVVTLELAPWRTRDQMTPLVYDRIDLLRPGNATALAADLAARTGMVVVWVEVHSVDLLHDSAEITVHHQTPSPPATRPDVT